ncbi:MAG: hypothetical protein ACPLN0_07465 [Candidatus Hydrothermia bacterium]
MKRKLKLITRPTVFGLIILMFFLPFTRISCMNNSIATLTGSQLAFGTQIDVASEKGDEVKIKKIKPVKYATATFALASLGFLLSFSGIKIINLILSLTSFAGVVMLLLLRGYVNGVVMKEGEGMFEIQFLAGYWIAFALFIVGILVGAWFFLDEDKEKDINQEEDIRNPV